MTGELVNIDLSGLSEPLTTFIEKVSSGLGILYKPTHVRRMAEAESEAEKIKEEAKIERRNLRQRAEERATKQQMRNQENIESIIKKSIDEIEEDANPEEVEEDWIANFFEKSKTVSDEDMQTLWSKILSGEANNPGSFSRKTVNTIPDLNKADAELFTNLCCYSWIIEGEICPLIYDYTDDIYRKNDISFEAIEYLSLLNLVNYRPNSGYIRQNLPEILEVRYFGNTLNLKFTDGCSKDNSLDIGTCRFTRIGAELARISGAESVDDFEMYIIDLWTEKNLTAFSEIG